MDDYREMKILECDEYEIYSPSSLNYITDKMQEKFLKSINEYKELFELSEMEQITINYFDDIEKFRKFIYYLRGEDTLPEYAAGTFDRGMINIYVPNNLAVGSPRYNHALYTPSHELFHILYLKHVLMKNGFPRIIWYDEGMAQFVSGEKSGLLDKERFKKYYLRVKENTKELPDFTNTKHGNTFCNELYNGYDLSYLAVRYLSDTLSLEEFKNLLKDVDEVSRYSDHILSDMFDYYDALFLTNEKSHKV